MATQQGFEYEKNVAGFLKKKSLVSRSFQPAAAFSDRPDLIISYGSLEEGCELKIGGDASAGSLVLKNWDGEWGFGDIDPTDKERIFIRDIVMKFALPNIQKEWRATPMKKDGVKDTPENYRTDQKNFRELRGEIPATAIEQYYNRKDTHYLNIGTHGFYLLGTRDPFKLNSRIKQQVPRFSRAARAIWRARVQTKKADNYQFTFEMKFGSIIKSPYNIGPVSGKDIRINPKVADLSCFGVK